MKKAIYIVTTLIITLALSCKRDELTYDYRPYCNIKIYVDWSDMTEKPEGLSVYCYPQDASEPTILETNQVDSPLIQLKEGSYNIIIFNRIKTGFGSLQFNGMNKFETAEVVAVGSKSAWYETKSTESLIREPEPIAITTITDYVVETECVKKSYENFLKYGKNITSTSISVRPTLITQNAHIELQVKNLDDVRDANFARGAVTNLSMGYKFASQTNFGQAAVQLVDVDKWQRTITNMDSIDGQVFASFSTFGTPLQTKYTRNIEYEWNGELTLDFKLVDDSVYTVIKCVKLDTITSTNKDLYLTTCLDNDTIIIPDVMATQSGGFAPDVDNWDEEDIDIEI